MEKMVKRIHGFTKQKMNDITSWELPECAITRLGQGGIMGNIIHSPDGQHFVVPSSIGVWWYNISTMTPTALMDTDRGYITAISFSPNGKRLATSDGDGLVKVWDVQNGVNIAQMDRDEKEKPYHCVSRFAFSSDSQFIAASSIRDYILYVWNTETGKQIAKFHDNTNYWWWPALLRPIAFSPDGSLIACTMPDDSLFAHADRRGTIRTPNHFSNYIAVWNIKTNEQIACITEHPDFVYSIVFSPCGKILVSGGRDGTVRVWSVETWKMLHSFNNLGTERKQLFYSPKGELFDKEDSKDNFTVWDVYGGQKTDTYLEEHRNIQIPYSTKDAPFIVADENEFRVWKVGDTQPHTFVHSHIEFSDSVVFTEDGKTLAGAIRDNGIMLWDMTKPSFPLTHWNISGNKKIVSSFGSEKISVTGIEGNAAKVWVSGESQPRHIFTLPNGKEEATSAAFAQVENLLVCSGTQNKLYIWNTQTKEILHTLTPDLSDEDSIAYLEFSPDAKLLFSVSGRGPRTYLWQVETGEIIDTFTYNTRVITFSPCKSIIACAVPPGIILWDVNHSETVIAMHEKEEDFLVVLSFSPCGRYLVSGSNWQRGMNIKKVAIRLWEVASGKNIATFRGHPTDIQSLAFSPDGKLLASASFDGTILLWDLKPYIDS